MLLLPSVDALKKGRGSEFHTRFLHVYSDVSNWAIIEANIS